MSTLEELYARYDTAKADPGLAEEAKDKALRRIRKLIRDAGGSVAVRNTEPMSDARPIRTRSSKSAGPARTWTFDEETILDFMDELKKSFEEEGLRDLGSQRDDQRWYMYAGLHVMSEARSRGMTADAVGKALIKKFKHRIKADPEAFKIIFLPRNPGILLGPLES